MASAIDRRPYDQNGQRDEIDTVKGSTVIVDESVRYSGTGGDGHRVGYLIERAPAPAVRVDYAYDSRGRLTGAVTKNNSTGSTVSNYSYTYDAASNRLTAKLGSTTNTFTYNTVTSRVTADSGGSYGYDAANAGNLVSSPGFSALGYNNAGQLTSADPVGSQQATTVAYNGPDANWEHSLTTPGGYGVTLTQSTLGAVRAREGTADTDYVRAPSGMLLGQHGNLLGQTAASTNRFYHHNHHGDVVAVTNGSGGVTDTWTYSPYGETVAHTGNMRTPFGWSAAAGYTTHESGLIHAGARYYQPRSGTWTQPDPQPDQPAYLYAGGDPINRIDPSGNGFWDVVDVVVGTAGVFVATAGVVACASTVACGVAAVSYVGATYSYGRSILTYDD